MSRNDNSGLLTGIGALVVGVAAGVTAVVLSKPENRKKLSKWAQKLMDESGERMDDVREKVEEGATKGKKLLAREIGKVQKKLEDMSE